MSAMTAIPAIGRALRAHPHPGYAVLLKTKAKPHFDRTVTDRSNLVFALLSAPNPVVPFPLSWLGRVAGFLCF